MSEPHSEKTESDPAFMSQRDVASVWPPPPTGQIPEEQKTGAPRSRTTLTASVVLDVVFGLLAGGLCMGIVGFLWRVLFQSDMLSVGVFASSGVLISALCVIRFRRFRAFAWSFVLACGLVILYNVFFSSSYFIDDFSVRFGILETAN